RDPADDGANISQSAFNTKLVAVAPVTANFRGKAGQSYNTATFYQITPYATPSFFDGWLILMPTVGLTSSNLDATALQLIRPFVLEGSTLPTTDNAPLPAGTGPIRDLTME